MTKKPIADCIRKNSETKDGTLISGHEYAFLYAVKDRETKRQYDILVCKDCHQPDVSYTDNFEFMQPELAVHYVEVGV